VAGRRNLYAITAASFIGFTGFTLVMPFLPFFIRDLGVTEVADIVLWTGAILGVTPAVTAIMAPVWGRLADRMGRKIMLVRSLASCAVVMAAMSLATRPVHVFALRAALGLLTGYGGVTLAMAAESAPRAQMASAIGLVQTAQRLGPAVGPVLGGLLAGFVSLRAAFLVTAGFYALALVLVLALYTEQPGMRASGGPPAAGTAGFRSVLSFENFLLLAGVIFGIQFVDRSIAPILPLYVEQLGVSPRRVPVVTGLLFSIVAVAASLGHHSCGRLLLRFSPRAVISGGVALAACGAALLAFAPDVWILAAATAMFGAGIGAALTAAYTAAGSVIPPGAHGSGFGALSSASLAGVAVSPVAVGLIAATTMRGVFLLDVIIMGALAAVVRRLMVESAPVTAPMVEDA
jgi:MFS family permease